MVLGREVGKVGMVEPVHVHHHVAGGPDDFAAVLFAGGRLLGYAGCRVIRWCRNALNPHGISRRGAQGVYGRCQGQDLGRRDVHHAHV